MQTRRIALTTLAGAALALGMAPRALAETDANGLPIGKTIAGKPPYMDFGDGVKVPLNKGAFATLWEGPSYWLTFGFGTAAVGERAKGLAVHRAAGAMKYLLLTLAFAPNKLQKVDGSGWRQKVEHPNNYVLGDLELPGRPGMPVSDASLGFGEADANLFLGGGVSLGISQSPGGPGVTSAITGMNSAAMLNGVNAFCSYVVKKQDLSLADIRSHAKNVVLPDAG